MVLVFFWSHFRGCDAPSLRPGTYPMMGQAATSTHQRHVTTSHMRRLLIDATLRESVGPLFNLGHWQWGSVRLPWLVGLWMVPSLPFHMPPSRPYMTLEWTCPQPAIYSSGLWPTHSTHCRVGGASSLFCTHITQVTTFFLLTLSFRSIAVSACPHHTHTFLYLDTHHPFPSPFSMHLFFHRFPVLHTCTLIYP